MWQWMHGGMWGTGWGGGMAMMVLFWLLLIAIVVWFFRSAESRASPGSRHETPLEILQRRYASGDIGRDEYEQKRRDLGD